MKPAWDKVAKFEAAFPHPLDCTEWLVKWTITGFEFKTYNPDFFCPALSCYVEVCTSKGNYSESRFKWAQVIGAGYPLRVYWWDGREITEGVKALWEPCELRQFLDPA